MAEFSKVIQRLRDRKIKEAVEGLRIPNSRDAFELGRLSGIQHGLLIAEQLVEEALNEDDDTEKPAVRRR